ncbi:hypothetical protein [Pectobacterium versatile]|uniref:hypothetical protein n=1 Tax=Pectobacterium versatile TaxID=2488639 RepID=UPI00102EBCDD|nr:hypothetical protein [Pectobacterium versatile]TAI92062.1 hypothetical protein EG331_03945 [Pectobacterium versatile]
MDVFSVITDKEYPVKLTQKKYDEITKRVFPYIQERNGVNVSYALCPCCKNPISLVNKYFKKTQSEILYAKHTGYTVNNIAVHDQNKYESCDFRNPNRMDKNKIVKRGSDDLSESIRNKLKENFDLLVTILKIKTKINFTDYVISNMLESFKLNEGHKCQCVTLFNLPYSFIFMTDAQSVLYCNVDAEIAKAITTKSKGFTCNNYNKIIPNNKQNGQIILFFSDHKINEETEFQTIKLNIAEIEKGQKPEQGTIVYSRILDMDMTIFDNYIRKKNFYLELAKANL